MSEFRFPPPPPPPPPRASLASDSVQQGHYSRQGAVHGRNRGRGFGNPRGRSDRGGYGGHQQRGQHANQATLAARFYEPHRTEPGPDDASSNTRGLSLSGLRPGSYINPAFMTNVSSSDSFHHSAVQTSSSTPTRTAAGHKRKLEALGGPPRHEKKPGPPTVPSTPSFGAGILPSTQTAHATLPQRIPNALSRKPASDLFGLNAHDEGCQYSSSDSDEEHNGAVDEESMYAELGTALTFEHNGIVMSLNSSADLAAWKNERKRNWPTKNRMAAKWEEKRSIGEKRKKLIADAIFKLSLPQSVKSNDKSLDNGTSTGSRQITPVTTKLGSPEQASKGKSLQIAKPEGSQSNPDEAGNHVVSQHIHPSSPRGLPGQAMRGNESSSTDFTSTAAERGDIDDLDSVDHESSLPTLSSHPTERQLESLADPESDDDEPPEEHGSKPPPLPANHKAQLCRYFSASGRCRDGESCRFQHDLPPQGADPSLPKAQSVKRHAVSHTLEKQGSERPSIFGLLTAREENEENVLALQVIKHLGDMGLFNEPERSLNS